MRDKDRSMTHTHDRHATPTRQRLILSIIATITFVLVEAITGYLSHSLALMSDAGHNFADALALIFAWYGVWIARKPSTARRTFGYHRVGTLAALVNSVSLVVIALLVFWEAINRLRHPEPVHSTPMIIVALLAILMNTVISLWLRGGAKRDLGVRSAYLHMLGDAISAAGVVVAGLIVAFTGASIADPVVSILIGILILWSSWGILKESVNVLLEAIPAGMNMIEVEQAIANVHGVLEVHDLHVWTIGSGKSKIDFDYDDARFEVLAPNQANAHSLSDVEINAALDAPIDCPSLADQIVTGDTVLIVVSDATRATGSAQIVNLLVRRLIENGIAAGDIAIIFATGIHRAVRPEEKAQLLTSFIAQRIRTLDHDAYDPSQMMQLGTMKRGEPIEINRALKEFSKVILTRGVDFPYFAGFTGGRNSICHCLGPPRTIEAT